MPFSSSASGAAGAKWLTRFLNRADLLWAGGLLAAAILLFSLNLGGVPLRDWDEGLVAQVAKEIWQAEPGSLRWLHPTLWGQPYFNKPPLMHLLIAGMYRLGGVNEWTARLPGAMLTALSVPLIYGIGRELFRQRSAAVFAALVYLTWLPIVRHGRLAMLDGAILCFFLLLLWCLLRSRRDPRWALGVGLGFGLMCLAKGAMGLLLGAIALMFLLWDAPRMLSSGYLWGGVVLGSLPVWAWYGAQWLHYGPEFLGRHVLDQSFSRIWQPVNDHQGPPWYYLLELLKYGLPWLLFVPQGFRLARQNHNMSWAKLSLIWGMVYLVVITAMSTKLPWYVLPLYPALALLAGAQINDLWRRSPAFTHSDVQPPPYSCWWMLPFALLALGGWGAGLYFGWLAPMPEPDVQLALVAVGLTMTVVTMLIARQDRQFIAVALWGLYVSMVLFVASDNWVWELGEDYPVKPVAALVQRHVPVGERVYTSHPLNRPSLNFYGDRQVLPASTRRLQLYWDESPQPYLLLSGPAMQRLALKQVEQLGTVDGWILIRRGDRQEPSESPDTA